jgi:hypothetical protein
MPKIAAYRYPGDPNGYVMVAYNTTIWDGTSNSKVGWGGNNWIEGGTVPTLAERLFSTSAGNGFSVDASLGRYNGMAGLSHYVGGFAHAFGDQRDSPATMVLAGRTTY